MSTIGNNSLHFDRGIDSISYALKETAPQSLPDRQQGLTPPSDSVKAQLSQLLDKPNLSSFLADALRPPATNPELLTPTTFANTLNEALGSLGEAAAAGGDDAKVLNRAVRQLKEETGLRDLVSMYRNALYQG